MQDGQWKIFFGTWLAITAAELAIGLYQVRGPPPMFPPVWAFAIAAVLLAVAAAYLLTQGCILMYRARPRA